MTGSLNTDPSREFHSKGHLLAAHKLGDGFYDLLLPPSGTNGFNNSRIMLFLTQL